MSRNTKFYSFSHANAPKLYNNSNWGELIKVIRYCVNGGEWFENGITQIVYEKEKEFVRVYLDNTLRTFSNYQTVEFNENCGIFSNKEAIIRLATKEHIDISFHDEIPELTDSTTVNLENMNIRIAKLGFTEAYTDRDCGVFKTENHDFYFCLNDNNPSNGEHTYLFNNTMMPRPSVYMCEGMDGIHSFTGKVFPYDSLYPNAYIGGEAFKFVNNSYIQNGLFGWDYQFSNGASNTAKNTSFSEIKWWIIGNGDNLIFIYDNDNANVGINCSNRCFFFQTVFNGKEYTPIMNGHFNSLTQHYYLKNYNYILNTNLYSYYSYTFGTYSATYAPWNVGKVYKPLNNLVSNTVILKSSLTNSPTSIYLYPTIYSTNRYSGLTGSDFDTSDRELSKYNIMLNNTLQKNGSLNYFKFINNNISSYYNGDIVRLVDNKNKDHLFFHFNDYTYVTASSNGSNDNTNASSSYHNEYKVKLFIDLLGKYDE